MKTRIKFLLVFYFFALISKPSLTEETDKMATDLENETSTKNLKDDPTEESAVNNETSNTFKETDSAMTETILESTTKELIIPEKGNQKNIVGGFNAQIGWYPYQVALFTEGWVGPKFYCGGSLISNYYVLTAAHCTVNKDRIKIVAGIISVENFGNTAQERNSKYIIIHEKYDHESGDSVHDISLIIVEKPFYFNNYVKPINLASGPPQVGEQCVVSGWGNIDSQHLKLQSNLKALHVKVVDPNVCGKMYKHWIDGMICSGFVKDQDFCFGDSGGPLVCDHVQHGVVSFFLSEAGDLCATGGPQVYTKIYFYRPWIDYYMNLHSYRKDNGSTASTKSESSLIRSQLFVISLLVLINNLFRNYSHCL